MASPAPASSRTYGAPPRVLPTSSSPYHSVASPFSSGLLQVSGGSPRIESIQCPENSYSLDDLAGNSSDSPEVVAKDWIKGLLDREQRKCFVFHSDSTIPLLLEAKFHPLLVGVHSRPDVVVCARSSGIPRLVIEVESKKNYHYTIQETILSMVGQFRVLRCFDDSISSCIGFTFPTISRRFGVTKVTLRYENLIFKYSLQVLDRGNVISEIKTVLNTSLPEYDPAFYPYLIRLSRGELDLFKAGAIQVQTKSSLVVHSHNRSTYWKYAPHCTPYFSNVLLFKLNLRHSLLPKERVKIGALPCDVYDGICPPLSREDARLCLSSLLPKLQEALYELHSNDIAHMDIRLENICFKRDGSIQLIDLDRCIIAHSRERDLNESDSDMYKVSDDWNNYQIDFRAVGMMLCFVLSQEEIPDYHWMVRNRKVDQWKNDHQFIATLLECGRWDDRCYAVFDEYLKSIIGSDSNIMHS